MSEQAIRELIEQVRRDSNDSDLFDDTDLIVKCLEKSDTLWILSLLFGFQQNDHKENTK